MDEIKKFIENNPGLSEYINRINKKKSNKIILAIIKGNIHSLYDRLLEIIPEGDAQELYLEIYPENIHSPQNLNCFM